jgi:hypothetical protein
MIKYDDPLVHEGCWHIEDIVMPTPFSAILMGKEPRVVTVIGINGNQYWIQEIMSNGQTSRGTVDRDQVKRA